jgi:predicted transcriptional regulator
MLNNYRIATMIEIVRFCEPLRDMSHIMSRLGLNSVEAESCIAILMQRKLLLENNGKYQITRQGRSYLNFHDRINRIVDGRAR